MKVQVFLDPDTGVQADPFIDELCQHLAWLDEWMFRDESLIVEVYYSPGDASMTVPPLEAAR